MLDRAIGEAGIDRSIVFVTNAVKHFKFELRGRTVTISKVRGEVLVSNGMRIVVTVHPFYLLRIENEERR
jgi:uracil-DNA glycosylase